MKGNFNEESIKEMAKLYGSGVKKDLEKLEELNEGLAHMILDHGFKQVVSREGLDIKYRQIATLTALISIDNEQELRTHTKNALRVGLSENELKELIIHLTLYLGYPRAIWAQKIMSEEFKNFKESH